MAYRVSKIKVLPGHQDPVHHSWLPSCAVVQQPNASHCKESSDTPSPHFPPPRGTACCSLNCITASTELLTYLSSTSHTTSLLPQKRGLKCMTRKEGLSQISSLSYLPQKAALTQPKVQLCDSSRSSVSLLFFFPPAMHSHPLPCASSTGICLTRQPASPGSYGSKKLFYSLQNMMFFASTAPLDCLRVCKGGPSALLCSCSP